MGLPSVAGDTLVLHASGAPSASAVLFLDGSQADGGGVGVPLFDGLRCVAGTIVRLGTSTASTGTASYPGAGQLPVAARSPFPVPGVTRFYQAHYRDMGSFCTPSTANWTNALSVRWYP